MECIGSTLNSCVWRQEARYTDLHSFSFKIRNVLAIYAASYFRSIYILFECYFLLAWRFFGVEILNNTCKHFWFLPVIAAEKANAIWCVIGYSGYRD